MRSVLKSLWFEVVESANLFFTLFAVVSAATLWVAVALTISFFVSHYVGVPFMFLFLAIYLIASAHVLKWLDHASRG